MPPVSCWRAEVERAPLTHGTSSPLRISACRRSSWLTTLRAGSEGKAALAELFPA